MTINDFVKKYGIDGKPLYQKTIIGNTIIGGTTTDKPHGISNLDEVVNAEILCHFSDNGFWRTLNFAYNNGTVNDNWLAGFAIDSINIKFQIGTSFANTLDKWRATIQYTRTTDTAGSGTWTTQGGYAHHYSTSEKVIGTWIDGKPLYEITVPKTNIAIASDNQIPHGVSNIKFCVRLFVDMYDSSDGRSWNTEACAAANNSGQVIGFRFYPAYILVSGNNNFVASEYRTWYFTLQYTKTTD